MADRFLQNLLNEWKPDETASLPGCNSWCTAHLWIVPAKVEGTWKLSQGELTLKQTFQNISGTLKNGASETAVSGKLNGEQISFSAGNTQYSGRVSGNSIEGSAGGNKWSATRASK